MTTVNCYRTVSFAMTALLYIIHISAVVYTGKSACVFIEHACFHLIQILSCPSVRMIYWLYVYVIYYMYMTTIIN